MAGGSGTQSPAPVLGPYKPVPITLPPAVNDPSFATFRNQLADIAKNKDRAALARLVAANFFWIPEDKDIADKQKSPIDNLSKALSLDGADGFGWESLAAYAAETTAMADRRRAGVLPQGRGRLEERGLPRRRTEPLDFKLATDHGRCRLRPSWIIVCGASRRGCGRGSPTQRRGDP